MKGPRIWRVTRAALAGAAMLLAARPARGVDADTRRLVLAVRSNDVTAVVAALEVSGPGLVNATIDGRVSPLHVAAALDLRAVTGLLVSRGARLEACTDGGFTPLHWAAGRDAVHAAAMLIDMGADVNARTRTGITPLHWAAENNATNVVRLLVQRGAELTPQTTGGLTPLHWAIMQDASEAAVALAYKAASDELDATPEPIDAREGAGSGDGGAAPEAGREEPGGAQDIARPREPRVVVGRTLLVPLGFGETLEFIWIDAIGLWAGKYEITNGQFRRFRPAHSSLFREGFSLDANDQPVVYVSWDDAKAFAGWLNANYTSRLPAGYRFRLPTDPEWQALASCGTRRTYPWGNEWPPRYGNFSDLTARQSFADWEGIRRYDDGYAVTCPVSRSGVNEWGLYGLAGNAWEWCEDWYGGERTYKVRRGGSWDFDPKESLRVDARGFDRPEAAYDTIGFRLVVSKPAP